MPNIADGPIMHKHYYKQNIGIIACELLLIYDI